MGYSSGFNSNIKTAVVGAGDYGSGLIFQIMETDEVEINLLVDNKIEKARNLLLKAGIDKEDIVHTSNQKKLNNTIKNKKIVIAENINLVPEAPVEVVVDCTGNIEAGAKLAYNSIFKGKHIVEVNVEMDVVVGPILSSMAQNAGVVYTTADGDQPSLAAGMVEWARNIGLEVIMAGKGTSLYTEEQYQTRLEKDPDISWSTVAYLDGTKSQIEMASIANITGLIPNKTGMHKPRVTLEEAVEIFSEKNKDQGVLNQRGVVDLVNCIAPDGKKIIEPRLANGVFVVVTASNSHSLQLMKNKGVIMSKDNERALLYRPHHLCGIETLTSIRKAQNLRMPTGAPRGKPVAEVVAVAKKDLSQGKKLDGLGGETVKGIIYTASEAERENYLPVGLANKVVLAEDVAKGEPITKDMLKKPGDSFAWKLRAVQEEILEPEI
ncbi:MAG: NAD(P)H-dependent oxidoreductase [Halanaerobiales bacterium]